jgi:vacuolar protein sorting-associated protein 11
VLVLNSAFKVVRSFPTYERDDHVGSIRHIKLVEGTSLLVTISEDLSSEPVLKVWALDKPEKKTGLPKCQSSVVVNNGRRMFPVCPQFRWMRGCAFLWID